MAFFNYQPILETVSFEEKPDSFFKNLYTYYTRHGLACIVISRVCYLLTTMFMTGFSFFSMACVDWSIVYSKDTFYIGDSIHGDCAKSPFAVFILFCFSLWMTYSLIKSAFYFKSMYSTHLFWRNTLKLPKDPKWTSWAFVMETYKNVDHLANSEYIIGKVLRYENYLVAMTLEGVLGLDENYFTKVIQWNLKLCFDWVFFKPNGEVDESVLLERNHANFARKLTFSLIFVGVVNAILAPFAFISMAVYFVYRYLSNYQKSPESLGLFTFTQSALWKLRDFNELGHVYTQRLNKSYPKIGLYLSQFSSESVNSISKFLSFSTGSVLLFFLIVSLLNQDIYVTENKQVLFFVGLFGAILVVVQSFQSNPLVSTGDPNEKFKELTEELHYVPEAWQKLGTKGKYLEIRKLFRLKWLVFIHEIVSVAYSPIVFIIWLPRKVDKIVRFFRNTSLTVDKLGTVCSYSVLNEDISVQDETINLKMSKSYMNFRESFPSAITPPSFSHPQFMFPTS